MYTWRVWSPRSRAPPRSGPTAGSAVPSRTAALSGRPVGACPAPAAASQGAVGSGPPAPSLDESCHVATGRWTVFSAQVRAMGVSASVSLWSQALNAPLMGWGPDTLPHSFPGGWTLTPQLPHLLRVIVRFPPA